MAELARALDGYTAAMPRVAIAIETSSRPSSVAISVDGAAPELVSLDPERSHARDLVPLLADLMAKASAQPEDIERIVVGTGPGSYTGLRVGCSTALGLSLGLKARDASRLLGIPSFEALALRALAPGERAAVLRNAFGGNLYLAAYGRSAGGLIEFQAPTCVAAADACQILEAESVWLADEGALKVIGDLVPKPREVRSVEPDAAALLSVSMLDAGQPSERVGPDAIKPLYLRPFDVKLRRR